MAVSPLEWIQQFDEYHVTSQDVWRVDDSSRYLKLDWNESTVASEVVRRKLIEFLQKPGSINWYPDISSLKLSKSIASYLKLSPLQILPFGGSDVALETMVRTYVTTGDRVGVVVPGYDNFRVYAEACGATVHGIATGPGNTFKMEDFMSRLEVSPDWKIIYLINPNNPLGYFIPLSDIRKILERYPSTAVIVDEAYIEFMPDGSSAATMIEEFDNLFVMRSFSKAFGLAGLRLGYIASAHQNLIHVNKLRNGKNISMFAQLAGQALLDNIRLIDDHVKAIRAAREWFIKTYRGLNGDAWESNANFVVIRVLNPQEVIVGLKAQGIYVRDRSSIQGMENCVRITIGYKEEMMRVVDAFQRISPEYWRFDESGSTAGVTTDTV